MYSENLFCRKCGKRIPSDSLFCGYCGEKVVVGNTEEYRRVPPTPYNTYSSAKSQKTNGDSKYYLKVFLALLAIATVIYLCCADAIKDSATTVRTNPVTTVSPVTTPKPSKLPENGHVFIGAGLDRESEITIKSSTRNSCYIKLKDTRGNDVFSFFVRSGCTVTVDVPAGRYYVYFAYGDEWYGTSKLFGENTVCAKDDDLMDFSNYTYTYTLYPVSNGNFSETPISIDDF